MKIYAGSDHAGLELKTKLVSALAAEGHEVVDLGTRSEEVTDYPDWADLVARSVRGEASARGLLVCGSGVGVSIVANKIPGIRAIDAWSIESARLSREHNDTNVLCLGQRLVPEADAKQIVDVWLKTAFEGGRHVRRLVKIAALEKVEGLGSAVDRELQLLVRAQVASRVFGPVAAQVPSDAAARAAAEACRLDDAGNPALELGAFITALAKQGRQRLTLVTPPALADFAAQVLRAFTENVPPLSLEVLALEALDGAHRYEDDRAFVIVSLAAGAGRVAPEIASALRMAGHPVLERELGARSGLAAEVICWQFAAAVVAASLSKRDADPHRAARP